MLLTSLVIPDDFCLSYGTHYVDHLTADGTCFSGREVTVVALLEVYADFP